MKDLTTVLIVACVFGAFSFLAWVFVDGARRRRQLQVTAEFHNKLLERMTNAREMAEFLDTPGGMRFVDSISMERTHPAQRILRAVQVGIVVCAAGIGCRVIGAQGQLLEPEAIEGFAILGIMLLSVGIGYLVSAGASFVLARTLGIHGPISESAR